MATMVLDVSNEGLMDQIMALFAPPSSENSNNNSNSETIRHKQSFGSENHCSISSLFVSLTSNSEDQWKKPRANCHDYCDSCGTYEGERLVCDRCPASFHLECLNPPMDPEDASTGVWYCHSCTMLLKDDSDSSSTNSSVTSSQISWSTSGQHTVYRRKVGRPKTRLIPSYTIQESLCKKYSSLWEESSGSLVVLSQLDQSLRYMNPKEFELPKDFLPSIRVSGSYKSESERKQRSIIELENAMVPYPIQLCDMCNKTCQIAPLLCCSFCPSCFHLDCLDPPLASFPPRAECWMCPNHPEQLLEETPVLILDPRLSTRLNVWSENLINISEVNYTQIINTFLHNTAQSKASALPWRNSSLIAREKIRRTAKRVKVPNAIKSMYTKLSTPLPRNSQPKKLTVNDLEILKEEQFNNSLPPSESDQELFVKSLFGLQMSIEAATMSMTQNVTFSESNNGCNNELSSSLTTDLGQDAQAGSGKVKINGHAERLNEKNSSISSKKRKDDRPNQRQGRPYKPSNGSSPSDNINEIKEDYLNQSDKRDKLNISRKERIGKLVSMKSDVRSILADERLVALLAQEHLSTLSHDPQNDLNPAEINAAKTLTCLGRDRSTGSSHNNSNNNNNDDKLRLICSSALKRKRLEDKRDSLQLWESVKCRAVLSPVSCSGPQIRLCYRTNYIGTDYRSQVCLTEFAQSCKSMSAQHAVIFYDERSRLFELVNYSGHGVRVNGVIYTNDNSSKDIYTPKIHNMVADVRQILRNNTSSEQSDNPHSPAKKAKIISSSVLPQCSCQDSISDGISGGWEGSAVLHHGSLIEIGCLKLLFSLVDRDYV